MRIVHLIARLNDGGPARVVRDLALGATAAGHTVRILAGQVAAGELDLAADLMAAGLTVERLPGLGRRPCPWDDGRALLALLRTLRHQRPDLLHTHTAKAGALGRIAAHLLGLPCLHTYHGHVLGGYFSPAMNRAVRAGERALAALGAQHHSLTPGLVRDLCRRHRIGRPWRWWSLPVPVRPVTPCRAAWADRLPPGRRVVGFLGRLVEVKDPGLWFDVLGRLATRLPVCGLVCGDGPLRAEVERRAAAAPVPVLVTGQVPAAEALAAMDLLLLTSRNEGQPLTAVEAAGAGVPVVGPAVGGLIDLASQDLLAVTGRRADNLAAASARLLLDDGLRRRHCDLARRAAVDLTPDAVVPRYLDLYRRLA